MTGLGYLGTDMVLDRDRGPMLLELNARPGLAIQMANGEGLRRRLDLIEAQTEERAEEHTEQVLSNKDEDSSCQQFVKLEQQVKAEKSRRGTVGSHA